MIAEVIIESNVKTLNRHFDYNIPKEMENNISIGSRVLIPFGRSKKLEEGFVTNRGKYRKRNKKIKRYC